MKIEKIQINNFRGFKGEHSIDFDPNLNVFVGRNGAGKSSILDAVGILLNHCFVLGENLNEDLLVLYSDISRNFPHCSLNIFFDFELNNKSKHEFGVKLRMTGDFHFLSLPIWNELLELLTQNNSYSIPLIRHFRFLSTTKKNVKTKPYIVEQSAAYKNAFTSNSDFDTFIEWFINEENEENRTKVKTRNHSI